MILQTKYHGEVEITSDEKIHFVNGLPGFAEEKSFVLLPLEKESPYYILQSTQTANLGFVVVNPFLFNKEYEFEISESDKELLELTDENDVAVWGIMTLRESFEESTINLLAPIIINQSNRKAKQIVLNDQKLTTKYKLTIGQEST
ncbi:flagellar assembly protein FliW [Metabacillus halosaccharovorans]|uniref:flagellar assembly protein FliW n=1 Tax=Metabacillus halosaccharovorans TaxID=930124 RepID=UPI0034CF41B9